MKPVFIDEDGTVRTSDDAPRRFGHRGSLAERLEATRAEMKLDLETALETLDGVGENRPMMTVERLAIRGRLVRALRSVR